MINFKAKVRSDGDNMVRVEVEETKGSREDEVAIEPNSLKLYVFGKRFEEVTVDPDLVGGE